MIAARPASDADFMPAGTPAMQIVEGTVGHRGVDLHYDYHGEDRKSGHPLVRVTLHVGATPGAPKTPGQAAGHEIVCRILGPLYFIPPKGTNVLVAIPYGMLSTAGAGVILGTLGVAPSIQLEPDRAVLDVGEGCHLILKGKSANMTSYARPAQWIGVGIPRGGAAADAGVYLQDETGSGMTIAGGVVGVFSAKDGDAKQLIQLSGNAMVLASKGNGSVKFADGKGSFLSNADLALVGARVMLGALVTPANRALWGAGGPAGVGSNTVFIAP